MLKAIENGIEHACVVTELPCKPADQDEEEYFFEGVEKLLEIWFESSAESDSDDDDNGERVKSLRSVSVEKLKRICEIAHCQILSVISNEFVDAYLLSESSMYVSDRRFILKTCGRTSLMHAVQPVLDIAANDCNLDVVTNIFYSRKNFQRPELQPEPHTNFEYESNHLDKLFDDGAGYCLGRVNHDRWYLYTLNPAVEVESSYPDQTLEILMTQLDESIMNIFFTEASGNADEASKRSGIDKLMPPGAIVDHFLFEPCGYSLNAILPHSDHYITIHITPEAEFSYVSFETNINQREYYELVKKILACFKPGRFVLTLIYNEASNEESVGHREVHEKRLPGYRRCDAQFLEIQDYYLSYTHHVKIDETDDLLRSGRSKRKAGRTSSGSQSASSLSDSD